MKVWCLLLLSLPSSASWFSFLPISPQDSMIAMWIENCELWTTKAGKPNSDFFFLCSMEADKNKIVSIFSYSSALDDCGGKRNRFTVKKKPIWRKNNAAKNAAIYGPFHEFFLLFFIAKQGFWSYNFYHDFQRKLFFSI